jgi:hypothetical protein
MRQRSSSSTPDAVPACRHRSVSAARRSMVGWVIVAAVTSAALPCGAGELQGHQWPCAFVWQDVPVAIPVCMDVVFVPTISIVASSIRLQQTGPTSYHGCGALYVQCNFALTLTCAIEPTGAVPGEYACTIANPDIDAPGGGANVCVDLQNADVGAELGVRRSVTVAIVTITVTSR